MSSSSQGQNPRLAKLFPLILVALGLALTFFGMSNLSTARESEDWPTVKGQVTRSEVERSLSSSGDNKYTYDVIVNYAYAVNGEDFSGHRVSFGMTNSSNPSAARFVTESYRLGATVTVYHDPTDPNQSVLEPGTKGSAYLIPGIGILFLLIAGLVALKGQFGGPKDQRGETASNPEMRS